LLQYQAAALIRMNESKFSKCLHGRAEFSAEERAKLAELFALPADWLFAEITPPVNEELQDRAFAPVSA
jgi:phage repressor protein C with HTH and peptisase S24 domain